MVTILEKYAEANLWRQPSVYFITANAPGSLIKIGQTKNLPCRFDDIKNMNPFEIILLGFGAGVQTYEKKIHQKFHGTRRHGEWFKDTKELREFISTGFVTETHAKLPLLEFRERFFMSPYLPDHGTKILLEKEYRTQDFVKELFETNPAIDQDRALIKFKQIRPRATLKILQEYMQFVGVEFIIRQTV